MANREENLKKINERLEQLTDEQLDKIVGGYNQVINYPIAANKKENLNPGLIDGKIKIRPEF